MYISNSKARNCIFIDAAHHRNSSQSSAFFSSLEYTVYPKTPFVLFAFVEALALHTLDFSVQSIKWKVAWVVMLKSLKIYLYGYLNGVELYKVRTVVRS
jgi:hypothetical protein